ncbi:MAG TPA: hypothetical protein VH253_17590 [Phycisphaerae bacterium]|nr:hypothetical protein [Phycisphaerae bacterium]
MPPAGLEKVYAILARSETTGYVNFDSKCTEAVQKYLPGYTNKLFAKELYEYIQQTGDLQERRQPPDDGWEAPFFYFSIPTFAGQRLYVKIILSEEDDDVDNCATLIVSLHPPTF